MDYKVFENGIIDFLTDNFYVYATTQNMNLTFPIVYRKGYPDGDVSGQVNFFLFPMRYEFVELTNDSKLLAMNAKVFILLKNLKVNSDTMADYLRDYATALDALINANNTLGGVVDKTVKVSIEFYDEVEGFTGSKGFEAELSLLAEVAGN